MINNNPISIGNSYPSKSFGEFTVLSKSDKKGFHLVRFKNTGSEREFRDSSIKKGEVRDLMAPCVFGVGIFGEGRFTSKTTHLGVKIYSRWSCIIDRCYSNRNKNNYVYNECTVCDEWLNFQNFAEWFVKNYPKDGNVYEVDKDKILNGNNLYCPELCTFISHKENTIIAKARLFIAKSPNGDTVEIYNMSEHCRKNGLCTGHMSEVISGKRKSHKGWTRAD